MYLFSIVLVLATLLFRTAYAYTLRGYLDGTLPNPSAPPLSFSASTVVLLQSLAESHATYLRAPVDAAETPFVFVNVSTGSYALSVVSPEHIFPVLRVDVGDADVQVYMSSRASEFASKGPRVSYPIELKPIAKAVYYQPRQGFNVLKLFKNPMLLISLVTMVIVFAVPKIMNAIDPETLKEIQEQQKQKAANQKALPNPMNFDMAAYIAQKTAPAASSGSASSSGGGNARSRKH
ncbi:uncharacterized protein V1518DRAFT_425315 [Limtongia smithiae]|uniref:uncharacterized protein n=1 Tax=Limtongia smithiae TaxID=1125753 RepID=UPI0034CD803C